jgi:hypothetical protein
MQVLQSLSTYKLSEAQSTDSDLDVITGARRAAACAAYLPAWVPHAASMPAWHVLQWMHSGMMHSAAMHSAAMHFVTMHSIVMQTRQV